MHVVDLATPEGCEAELAQCVPSACREGVDLAIVLDQSNNLDPNDVQRELDFVFEFVLDAASVDVGTTRLALVTYAAAADVQFHLADFADRRLVLDSISAFHSYVLKMNVSIIISQLISSCPRIERVEYKLHTPT